MTFAASLPVVACSSSSSDGGGGGSTYPGSGGTGSDAAGGGPVGTFGDGGVTTSEGGGDPGSNGTLTMVLRDFKLYKSGDVTTNADFENVPQNGASFWDDREIVSDTLGSDGKPVYKNASGTTLTTHGATGFNQWYNDTPKCEHSCRIPNSARSKRSGRLRIRQRKGRRTSWRRRGRSRCSFQWTTARPTKRPLAIRATHTTIRSRRRSTRSSPIEAASFSDFRGDDDVFVYVNKKLLINLGGIHEPETGRIECDALGLTKGDSYPLDFFFAERHKGGSNVLFTTTLKLTPVIVK